MEKRVLEKTQGCRQAQETATLPSPGEEVQGGCSTLLLSCGKRARGGLKETILVP